jgi:putative ABC transport system permease protein
MFKQSLRMTQRDWRAGELRFLLLALIVAVAALSAVGFFVDRMRAGLNRDAHQVLGADLLLSADLPVAPSWVEEGQRRGLKLAHTIAFTSMAIAGEGAAAHSQLASVKAVTQDYPLRGKLRLAATVGGAEYSANGIPAPSTVWVDANLLSGLQLTPGQTLRLGDMTFTIAALIVAEPDRGASFMNFAPRVMLSESDLAATHLIRYGSRATYRLLIAGEPESVTQFQTWLKERIEQGNVRGVRMESLENGQPEMRATLDRAERFLALVGLLSAMLAAVAVAMAARRFMLRHVDACAMLRCLGATQGQVTRMYLLEFLAVGLVGSALGVAIGFSAHFALLEWLGKLVTNDLPPAGIMPAFQGMAIGLLLLVGFAIPPILQLANVPHNRVIRREQDPPRPMTLVTYALGLLSFSGLLLWQSGNAKLGALTVVGFLVCTGLFALCGWGGIYLLRWAGNVAGAAVKMPNWRFALTRMQRRPGMTVVQIVALSLGLMALLLLTVIRADLVSAWRAATPADAPNRFIINIQPDQKDSVEALIRANGVNAPQLYPMTRGRLVQINDAPITATSFRDGQAMRMVEREFNLSTMRDMPPSNKISAGRWFDDSAPEASVEEGIAKTLNLKLGDRIAFDIAGQQVSATITSLRKLDWGSMRVNFFVIINPAAMREAPRTWITAFHLPRGQVSFASRLAQDYPNVTMVDVGSILAQVQGVIDQVVTAVEFLFLFTLCSGVLVLYSALAASQDERTREGGLLRALGATRRQLARAQWIEVGLTGALSGLLAASGAAAIGWALARFVFEFSWVFDPWLWLAGLAVGMGCAFIGGWAGLRNVLNQPPLQTLREA